MIPTVTLTNATPQLMPTQKDDALAKSNQAATDKIITSTEVYRERLASWQAQHFNILTPSIEMTGLAVQHGLIACKISIDPNPDAGEVYGDMPWLKKNEFALAKLGLRKIKRAAGISTAATRVDGRTIPNYWEFQCVASWLDVDGSIVRADASKDWDMRDGSDLLKGFTPAQIQQARRNGLRHCETRATNAAIREYGLKQKYTRAELEKPFVVVRVMYMPDTSDPETRRILTEGYLRGTSALYAHTPAAALGVAPNLIVDVEADDETPAATNGTPEGVGLMQDFKVAPIRKKDGSTFSKWTAVDHNGVPHVTVNHDIGKKLQSCFDEKTPVEIVSSENNYGENAITEVIAHDPKQPRLPDTGSL